MEEGYEAYAVKVIGRLSEERARNRTGVVWEGQGREGNPSTRLQSVTQASKIEFFEIAREGDSRRTSFESKEGGGGDVQG